MKRLILLSLFLLLFGNIAIISSCSPKSIIAWDNDIAIEKAVTALYSDDFLEMFVKNRLCVSPVPDLREIRKYIKVECVRKTYQGYYAVFLSETGRALLVFYDEDGQYREYQWNQAFFSTKEDFERIVQVGKTVRGDIIGTIGGAYYPGGSGIFMTVQVVEGVYQLECWWSMELPSYSPDSMPGMECKIPENNIRIVSDIYGFFSNKELEENKISAQINYVLPRDKEYLSQRRWWENENGVVPSESFDPFDGIAIIETGYNGNGLAAPYVPDNPETRRYRIDTVGRRGFSNGDTVTLYAFSYLPIGNCIDSLDYQDINSLRQYCTMDLRKTTGKEPVRVFYNYTFEGLPDLVTDVNQLDERGIDSVVRDALDSVAEVANLLDVEGWKPVRIGVYPSHDSKTQEMCQAFTIVMEMGRTGEFVVLGTHYVGIYPDGSVRKIYDNDKWTLTANVDGRPIVLLEEAYEVADTMFPRDGSVSVIELSY